MLLCYYTPANLWTFITRSILLVFVKVPVRLRVPLLVKMPTLATQATARPP